MKAEYTALVIGYKQPELVASVLACLADQTILPVSVIVVDNGGTFSPEDRSGWPLAERSHLISLPHNPGYAAAVNVARHQNPEDLLLVCTHDARFGASLSKLLSEEFATANVGAAGPVLALNSDLSSTFSAGGKITRTGRARHFTEPLYDDAYEVDWLDGAIVMYSTEALDSINWLDERYFLYFEDVDTCWRLNQAGWRCRVKPSVRASQEPGEHPIYLGMRNMVFFGRRAGISTWLTCVGLMLRFLSEMIYRLRRRKPVQFLEAIRGIRDGFRYAQTKSV